MKTYWYSLLVDPIPWRVGPVQVHRSQKSQRMGAHVGKDQELAHYQEAVREMLKEQGAVKIDGDFAMRVYFWRKMETYKTAASERARNQEADGTNLYKAFEDACHGVLYDNDKNNKNGDFVVVEQGPEVEEGRIVVKISEWSASSTAFLLTELPDAIFAEVNGDPMERLQIAVAAPTTTIEPSDDEYGNSQVSF